MTNPFDFGVFANNERERYTVLFCRQHIVDIARTVRIGCQTVRLRQLINRRLFSSPIIDFILQKVFDGVEWFATDANNLKPPVRKLGLQGSQMRHALDTWTASSCPKLDNVYFARLKGGNLREFSVPILDPVFYVEFWSDRAHPKLFGRNRSKWSAEPRYCSERDKRNGNHGSDGGTQKRHGVLQRGI